MADSTIGVTEAGTPNKLLDTTSLTVGMNTVERERIQVAGAAAAELADVKNAAPSASAYGIVARLIAEAIGNALFAKVTDGTDVALVTGSGELSVLDSNSAAIKTAVEAIQTAIQLIDDAIVADDAAFTPASTRVMMAGFEYDDSTPDSVNEGDAGAARMSANRNVYVQVRDAAGNERGLNVDANGLIGVTDGGGSLTIDGSVSLASAVPAGTNNIGDVDVASIAAGDNNIGNVDIVTFPAEVHSADFDTGVGTDTTLAFGIAVPASGGAAVIPGDATAGLKVDLGADNDVVVTGTVTANAGTNLNTSALALESGGNLAAAVTALQIIDDWDETDRAKVNIIAGQAGVTAGAGAVAANTPRVTLASDDPAVTALQILDDWDQSDRAKVNAINVSGKMVENDVVLDVKPAVIDAATAGDNTLVAAVTNKKIRVLSAFLVAAGTVAVRFESGAGGTPLTGQMNLVANTGFVLPHNPHGWFQTADSTLLNLELSAAVSVDGALTYIEAE